MNFIVVGVIAPLAYFLLRLAAKKNSDDDIKAVQ
jgi:heme/copper-type cytochrome/quinol oxidase subunit 2